MPTNEAPIVALDVGSSSVRTLLFGANAREVDGFGAHESYHFTTDHDGRVEKDADALLALCFKCLTAIHGQLQHAGIRPAAIAFDAFWHSFLGINASGQPVTPLLHLFDTRSAHEATELAQRLDARAIHARTGCRLHTSYWPAKLLWLGKHHPDLVSAASKWISFGEYLFLHLFGEPVASTSMVSGSGLWDQMRNTYDPELLEVLPIRREQLCPEDLLDQPRASLAAAFRARWPLFDGIPWYPALGDGACNNIGSGCDTEDQFALMVGTSGAMRAVVERPQISIPDGLWCYRVDRRRFVLGGSLSNGGNVFAWMRRTLLLPSIEEAECLLAEREPGNHGLIVLPFFAGERSPFWRSDLRGAIVGLDLTTKPLDLMQAALEAVALRFREIYDLMRGSLNTPRQVIASGGALLASPAWLRMMTDAVGARITCCTEPEATCRGAVVLALERLGLIQDIKGLELRTGPSESPDPGRTAAFEKLEAAQQQLFKKLFVECK